MSVEKLLDGIRSTMVETSRLNTHVLISGAEDNTPVILVHGNVSSNRFWEETMVALADQYYVIAPDLRGFGHSETKAVDATRGVSDFADDLHSLTDALGINQFHLVGWSLGGGVVMQYTLDHPEQVASLVLVAPVGPYGYGCTKDNDGTPCFSDYAGSGGGTANPEFVQRLTDGDRGEESQVSPRNVMNALYFKPPFRPDAAREEVFVTALLETKTGAGNYPGDMTSSENWPTVAPGRTGVLNSIAPAHFNLSRFAEMATKVPVLWVRGDSDQIVADGSSLDFGFLGQAGVVPGWPGADVFPPQPMVTQTRAVLDRYQANGGSYREAVIGECGHSPHVEKPIEFQTLVRDFWG